ncbi:cytochrome P450 [Xylariomycetidae sp. FL2044]|nr:cytochrome P450 [Xylariomycetidae sp. FL2044]
MLSSSFHIQLDTPKWDICAYALLFFVSYKALIYIQRLFFHPLSAFPGPRICAASTLYEFYWDAVQRGRFWAALPALHDKYGPIVRIGPNEVHIRDSEYFNYLFGFNSLDKDAKTAKQFGLNYAMFGTERHEQYVPRRAAYGNAFSRSRILRLEPMLQEKINSACARIQAAAAKGGSTDIAYFTRALTAEIITEYMYGQGYGFFDDEEMTKGFYTGKFDTVLGLTHLGRFIPFWIPLLITFVRHQINSLIGVRESMGSFMMFSKFADKMVQRASDEHGVKPSLSEDKDYDTAIEVYLRSALPESDKVGVALRQATQAVWAGGWDTTSFSMTVCVYLVLKHPEVLQRLQRELDEAWQTPSDDVSVTVLDKLPYFDAVLNESLRFVHGALTRLTRINPTNPEQYKSWVIPPGTKISMSLSNINLDQEIWGDDVKAFRPERWLGNPHLKKCLATFSKGTRVCLGIEFAYVELKMTLAALFRRFDMGIVPEANITDDEILPYTDRFAPGPKANMQFLPVTAAQRP